MTGPRTIIDLQIDGADQRQLRRWNWRFRLGLKPRWWWSGDRFRELVRAGLHARMAEARGESQAAERRFLEMF